MENTEYTKHYIIEALFLLMKEKDFHDISVIELTHKAGVGRATFYRYFKDKEEVIKSFLSKMLGAYHEKTRFIPRCEQDFYEIIVIVLKMLEEKKEYVRLMQKSHLEYLYLDFMNEGFVQMNNLFSGNKLLPYGYAGALYNISMEWVREDCAEPLKEVAKALFITVFDKERYEAMEKGL